MITSPHTTDISPKAALELLKYRPNDGVEGGMASGLGRIRLCQQISATC
jgi:hypothetical protein